MSNYLNLYQQFINKNNDALKELNNKEMLEELKKSKFYNRLIFIGCETNNKELVELLLNYSPSKLICQDIHGRTPLMSCLLHQSLDVIVLLLSIGDCRLDIVDSFENNILHYLSNCEVDDLIELLSKRVIEEYPLFIKRKNALGESPLHLSIEKGNIKFAQLLLDNGAPLNQVTNGNQSLLDYALYCTTNQIETIQFVKTKIKEKEFELEQKKIILSSKSEECQTKIDSSVINQQNISEKTNGNIIDNTIERSPPDVEVIDKDDIQQVKENPTNAYYSSLLSSFFKKKEVVKTLTKEEEYQILLESIEINDKMHNSIDSFNRKKKFRMISIDGGGIKCILQAIIFSRLVEKFPTLLEEVNLFCGVSASSFICADLALGIHPKDIKKLMIEMCKHSFEKKSRGYMESMYSNKYLIDVAQMTYGEKKLSDIQRYILINAFQFDSGENDPNRCCKACVFNNFIPGYDCKIGDACLRSAAAVGYYPPYQGYADGGIFENNPCVCAFPYIFGERGLGIDINNTVCLSISSGRPPINYMDSNKYTDVGLLQLLPLCIDGFLWSRKSMADDVAKGFLGERYMRFDPILPNNLDLDCNDQVEELIELANNVDITSIEEWILKYWL
ncbi:hypothetical protein ENUP19_0085G0118 [Entamoeba nuttalli]|uniref:phospholipase A2 n=2 Tax=Entamoeba nuttalli TaxID=412467 RepID=K2GQM4_ENTNP|nr:phospholipase, patatin family protein [Entamoeba nuttalli P19]EKE37243.1 phospholipase, patatin family protein [Entamoeba nuttalli P19]|eukprot:XP_008860426.1 phospholipase, patatin family protein [Entamoeba nuttalli P19]